ncbi:MAG: class III poly(R)-hydroxyalkanoic acid synthase subunit PhaE, partial [Microcystaceae cyanobacterium]
MQTETNPWTEMANPFGKLWLETGTQMWKNWFEVMGNAGIPNPVDLNQPNVQHFSQKLLDNQALYVQLLQTSFQAWQNLFPKLEAGENWQQPFGQYLDQLQQQLQQASFSSTKVSQDLNELWQLYLKEIQKFNQLCLKSVTASFPALGQTGTEGTKPWLELNKLYWNLLYDETLGGMMQSPGLGLNRELNGKLLKGFDVWTELYRATTDYQILSADIQYRSFEALMKELVMLYEQGKKIKDWREFQQISSVVSDRIFEETFQKEENLKIRGKFINTLNSYRLQQQVLLEEWMKSMN